MSSPGEAAWLAFFDRGIKKTGVQDEALAFERLMKFGTEPNYWNEFLFEGYVGHSDDAIWVRGLPDIAASRPHSPEYGPRFVIPEDSRSP